MGNLEGFPITDSSIFKSLNKLGKNALSRFST